MTSTKGDSDYVWSLRDINFEIEQGDAVELLAEMALENLPLLKLLSRVTKPYRKYLYQRQNSLFARSGHRFSPRNDG